MMMNKSRSGNRLGAFLAGALATVVAVPVVAQPIAPPPTQTAPQPDTPDLEGVWKIATPTNTLKPVSGSVPFTAEGRKRYDRNKRFQAKKAYEDYDIALSRCSSPGTPRLMLIPSRFKIWQMFGVVTFDFEWNRATRQINASKLPPKLDFIGEGLVPSMTGDSVGHWEGDTLVAQTTNLSDRTLIDDLVPHTVDMKVTERIRLLDADTLEDRITIEDPAYFTKPWDAVVVYKRQPSAVFPEDVCLDRREAHQPIFPQ
ncbi:hypothetical protein WSK_1033 [Novosphingobium sp. Rr 2-17]|uniref:hypothetical protein n=1 Tax=Novosphingobium sp. Rr 2-17 TaxID=555793 RepID=UPI0002699B69|nr:hypothetical protein [Novosphingobium sp. Rr 2-17]EIZ80472.1 hypothetical protein WSK_1033 [Novosphingobium sp. Rr 2-17]